MSLKRLPVGWLSHHSALHVGSAFDFLRALQFYWPRRPAKGSTPNWYPNEVCFWLFPLSPIHITWGWPILVHLHVGIRALVIYHDINTSTGSSNNINRPKLHIHRLWLTCKQLGVCRPYMKTVPGRSGRLR